MTCLHNDNLPHYEASPECIGATGDLYYTNFCNGPAARHIAEVGSS